MAVAWACEVAGGWLSPHDRRRLESMGQEVVASALRFGSGPLQLEVQCDEGAVAMLATIDGHVATSSPAGRIAKVANDGEGEPMFSTASRWEVEDLPEGGRIRIWAELRTCGLGG